MEGTRRCFYCQILNEKHMFSFFNLFVSFFLFDKERVFKKVFQHAGSMAEERGGSCVVRHKVRKGWGRAAWKQRPWWWTIKQIVLTWWWWRKKRASLLAALVAVLLPSSFSLFYAFTFPHLSTSSPSLLPLPNSDHCFPLPFLLLFKISAFCSSPSLPHNFPLFLPFSWVRENVVIECGALRFVRRCVWCVLAGKVLCCFQTFLSLSINQIKRWRLLLNTYISPVLRRSWLNMYIWETFTWGEGGGRAFVLLYIVEFMLSTNFLNIEKFSIKAKLIAVFFWATKPMDFLPFPLLCCAVFLSR